MASLLGLLPGPGWFSDPFEIDIELDNAPGSASTETLFAGYETSPLYPTGSDVTGTVTITAPEGSSVWVGGVVLEVEVSAMVFEEMDQYEVATQLINLREEPFYVKGAMKMPFRLPLGELAKSESFDGDLFCIRHELSVMVTRPWYTFNVSSSIPLCVQHLSSPSESSQDEAEIGHTVQVTDCGGLCTLDFGSSTLWIGDPITFDVHIAERQNPLSKVSVIFYRIESTEDDDYETVLAASVLYDDPASPILGAAAQFTGTISLDAASLLRYREDKGDDGEMGPPMIVPSFAWADEDGSSLQVRYFLRLRVEDVAGDAYWATNEMVLRRSALRTSPLASSSQPANANSTAV